MSHIIASAIGNALSAGIVVTPTDGRDSKYFAALNKVARNEFVKSGFIPDAWDTTKWQSQDTHSQYWVANLISVRGLSQRANINLLFEDGNIGYVLKGFSIKVNSYDDQYKPTELFAKEYIKEFDNYKALVAMAIGELRQAISKLNLLPAFDIKAVESYTDFSNALMRIARSRGGAIDWIPSLVEGSLLGMGLTSHWNCTKDYEGRRSEMVSLFTELNKSGKVEIPLEFTSGEQILNPKTLVPTLLEVFPNLRQDNDLVIVSIKDAKYSGSSLKVTFVFKKK